MPAVKDAALLPLWHQAYHGWLHTRRYFEGYAAYLHGTLSRQLLSSLILQHIVFTVSHYWIQSKGGRHQPPNADHMAPKRIALCLLEVILWTLLAAPVAMFTVDILGRAFVVEGRHCHLLAETSALAASGLLLGTMIIQRREYKMFWLKTIGVLLVGGLSIRAYTMDIKREPLEWRHQDACIE